MRRFGEHVVEGHKNRQRSVSIAGVRARKDLPLIYQELSGDPLSPQPPLPQSPQREAEKREPASNLATSSPNNNLFHSSSLICSLVPKLNGAYYMVGGEEPAALMTDYVKYVLNLGPGTGLAKLERQ